MTDALDILNRLDADDEAVQAAIKMERGARSLLRFYRINGRLPWPAATDAREVHRMLEEIVMDLDLKKEASNAA